MGVRRPTGTACEPIAPGTTSADAYHDLADVPTVHDAKATNQGET